LTFVYTHLVLLSAPSDGIRMGLFKAVFEP
jgi:hypothetical protein